MKTILIATLTSLLIALQSFLAPSHALAQTPHHPGRIATLRIDGMESEACPVLVKRAVMKIQGVQQVDASLANHSATIEYDERHATLEEIQRVIKRQVGFDSAPM